MTDILTTYVSKGGTGKTTITVNFAAMAASKGKKGKEFDYEVGATVKNNYIPLAPSDKELKKLAKVATHGTLVLTRDKKEIARYSLEDLKPIEK